MGWYRNDISITDKPLVCVDFFPSTLISCATQQQQLYVKKASPAALWPLHQDPLLSWSSSICFEYLLCSSQHLLGTWWVTYALKFWSPYFFPPVDVRLPIVAQSVHVLREHPQGSRFTQSKEGLSDPAILGGSSSQVVVTSPQGKGHSLSLVREKWHLQWPRNRHGDLCSHFQLRHLGNNQALCVSFHLPASHAKVHSSSMCLSFF